MLSRPTPSALLLIAALVFTGSTRVAAADFFVYYGSPDGGAGKGISLGRFDSATGALTAPQLAVQAEGPSFLALAADGKHLYACLEKAGSVGAYAIDPATGALRLLNTQPSGGAGPCHLSFDRTGRFVLVANYDAGSVAVFPLAADGTLGGRTGFDQHTGKGPNAERQEGPHAHGIITDPTNRFALCCDLGNDRIHVYRFDASTGTLTPNTPATLSVAPGAGPRHPLFSADGKVLYVINEMGATVTAFNWDAARGTATEFQTVSTLPADFKAFNKDAEVKLHPNGKFLYASARGHDSIAVFAIEPATGRLTLAQDVSTRGQFPRHFNFDPTGAFVVAGNQDSNTVVAFRADAATGRLTPVGEPVAAPAPICMLFLPVPAGAGR